MSAPGHTISPRITADAFTGHVFSSSRWRRSCRRSGRAAFLRRHQDGKPDAGEREHSDDRRKTAGAADRDGREADRKEDGGHPEEASLVDDAQRLHRGFHANDRLRSSGRGERPSGAAGAIGDRRPPWLLRLSRHHFLDGVLKRRVALQHPRDAGVVWSNAPLSLATNWLSACSITAMASRTCVASSGSAASIRIETMRIESSVAPGLGIPALDRAVTRAVRHPTGCGRAAAR